MSFNFLTALLCLSSPMTWLIAAMAIAGWHRVRRMDRKPEDAARIVNVGPSTPEAVGNVLMFLSMAYRPNQAFIARAQIVEREDTEDDEQGGPDTPQRHFMRQLRRIRRGEAVDRLVWRLE